MKVSNVKADMFCHLEEYLPKKCFQLQQKKLENTSVFQGSVLSSPFETLEGFEETYYIAGYPYAVQKFTLE